MGAPVKVAATTWVETARDALIEEGIGGLRVNRLAQRLGVTRGGFFHNFIDRDELLAALLSHWRDRCRFLPDSEPGTDEAQAAVWFQGAIDRLIGGDGYDAQFDLAVREWARSDASAAQAVREADDARMATLKTVFAALGCDEEEAGRRARVLYRHQIGCYAVGACQPEREGRRSAELCLDILCGQDVMKRVRGQSRPLRATG